MAMSTSLSMKVATTPMKARYNTMKAFGQLEREVSATSLSRIVRLWIDSATAATASLC
jgi:hypothetical protein